MAELREGDRCPECQAEDLTENEAKLGVCYDCYQWLDRLRVLEARNKTQATRIAELEAVVEKLPKTVDGVPVVPGMKVWCIDYLGKAKSKTIPPIPSPDTSDIDYGNVAFYSTRATAEAAKEASDAK